jgi:GH35 family endo-1,4-beta-xylanase
VPLDKPGMTQFLKQIQDLGLETMITEFDVDDVDLAGPVIDQTVADKYAQFIDIVGPFVKVITFEGLRDDPNLPKRPDGLPHRPNLLDAQYEPTLAYNATVKALNALPRS